MKNDKIVDRWAVEQSRKLLNVRNGTTTEQATNLHCVNIGIRVNHVSVCYDMCVYILYFLSSVQLCF